MADGPGACAGRILLDLVLDRLETGLVDAFLVGFRATDLLLVEQRLDCAVHGAHGEPVAHANLAAKRSELAMQHYPGNV